MASCFNFDLAERPTTARGTRSSTLVGRAQCSPSRSAYEDLNDHDELRHDPLFHDALAGFKLEAKRSDCAPVAGKVARSTGWSTGRGLCEAGKYHKIDYACAEPGSIVRGHLPADGHKRSSFIKEIVLRPRRSPTTRFHGSSKKRSVLRPWLILRQLLANPAALHLLRPVRCSAPSCAPPTSTGNRRRGRRRLARRRTPACRRPLASQACGSCCAADSGFCARGADRRAISTDRGCRLPVRRLAPNARLKAVLAPECLGGSAVVPTTIRSRTATFCSGISPTRQSDLLEQQDRRQGLWARPSTCPTVPIRVSCVTSLGREKIDARGLLRRSLLRPRARLENRRQGIASSTCSLDRTC